LEEVASDEWREREKDKDNAEAQSFAEKRNPRAQPGMAVPQEEES
jgi:hypothetical protein